MIIKILKKHMKDMDYFSRLDCPLAKALKHAGYTKVSVGGFTATAYKNKKKFDFTFNLDAHRLRKGIPFKLELNVFHRGSDIWT